MNARIKKKRFKWDFIKIVSGKIYSIPDDERLVIIRYPISWYNVRQTTLKLFKHIEEMFPDRYFIFTAVTDDGSKEVSFKPCSNAELDRYLDILQKEKARRKALHDTNETPSTLERN